MILRDAWYRQMPGLMALMEEKKVLDRVLKNHRGTILLQIGGPGDTRLTEKITTSQLVFLDTHYRTHHEKPYIQANYQTLPIADDSIDTVLLMHALELSKDLKVFLKEVHRILKPSGSMVVCCFNRWSVWNAMHWFGRKKVFPKAGRCYALSAIKKQLLSLDMEIVMQQTVCFRPPFLSRDTAKKWLFLETLGQMIAPYCGAVVMVMATKKVIDVTPLIDLTWVKEMAVPQGVRA